MVTYDSISVTMKVVSFEISNTDKDEVTASVGLSAPLPPGISVGFQVSFTTDVNDGKYGTLENEKDPELNYKATEASRNFAKIQYEYATQWLGGSF